MKELINEEGRIIKCIETSKEFKKLIENGFKIKEEENSKEVKKTTTRKTNTRKKVVKKEDE